MKTYRCDGCAREGEHAVHDNGCWEHPFSDQVEIVTDYSKPTHWECRCGDIWAKNTAYACTKCLTDVTIPVYPIIPPGERPEAEEPEEGTVCVFKGLGDCEACLCTDSVDAGRWSNLARGEWRHGKGRGIRVSRLRTQSEPDAVLYVAEGVLP